MRREWGLESSGNYHRNLQSSSQEAYEQTDNVNRNHLLIAMEKPLQARASVGEQAGIMIATFEGSCKIKMKTETRLNKKWLSENMNLMCEELENEIG